MSKNAFIFHGSFGNSEDNWIPWLKTELEGLGYDVITPDLPTPQGQDLKNWLSEFSKYRNQINENTIMIGHSIAPAFIVDMLLEWKIKVDSCYFVSGFYCLLNDEKFDPVNKTFFVDDIDWNDAKMIANRKVCFYSDNDPYIPQTVAEWLADRINAEKIVINGGGHLNEKFGYLKFEQLLEKIKSES